MSAFIFTPVGSTDPAVLATAGTVQIVAPVRKVDAEVGPMYRVYNSITGTECDAFADELQEV